MNNVENNINYAMVDVIVRSTLQSTNENFELCCSVDDKGEVLLTPVDVNTQFVEVSIHSSEEDLMLEKTAVLDETTSLYTLTSDIRLQANMIVGDDNKNLIAEIDAIGQCVIRPSAIDNMFVSASLQNSLNIIAEEAELDQDSEEQQEVPTDVTATVIEENINNNYEDTLNVLAELTNNFTDTCGTIECDTDVEVRACLEILSKHYSDVAAEGLSVCYTGKLL